MAVHVGHESPVRIVQFSPNGQWVASADEDCVILWHAASGVIVSDRSIQYARGLAFTPESQKLVICTTNRLMMEDLSQPFDITADIPLEHAVNKCIWSPDGELCLLNHTPGATRISIYWTRTMKIHSYHVLPRSKIPSRSTSGDYISDGVCDPAFSPDSRRLLWTYWQTTCVGARREDSQSTTWIWDIYSTAPPLKLLNDGSCVCASSFNPVDAAQVFMLLDDGTIQIRDASTGAVLIAVQGGHTYRQQVEMPDALFSSDGSHIATAKPLVHGDRDGARLSNIRTASVLDPLKGSYERGFSWLLFSPDGSCILSTSLDAPAKLWDVHTKRTIISLKAHMNLVYAASFSPDGRYIASGYEDGTVRLWNAENGACLAIFTEHTGRVTRIVFSRDGETLCSAAADGSVYMKRMCAVLQH